MIVSMDSQYKTVCDFPVRILCNDALTAYSVIGLVRYGDYEILMSWTLGGQSSNGDRKLNLVEVSEKNELLGHIAALEAELAESRAECERLRKLAKQFAEKNTVLRKIACHVPGRAWMKASEECGYGNTVAINDHKIDEAWLEFTSIKPKEPTP